MAESAENGKVEDVEEQEKVNEEEGEDDKQEKHEEEDDDPEILEMRKKVKAMEEEAKRIQAMQTQAEAAAGPAPSSEDADLRSIYIGNVDYGATAEELQAHFQSCGTINRLTIMTDKFTGHPKGFAYLEFAEVEAATNSLALNESIFRGRQLKVTPKRTNVPGMARGRGRGRGGRGFYGGYRGGYRGRGRRFQGYSPY